MTGAPPEESFGSDSTKHVKVPWDLLQSYYFRAARTVMQVPEASRLAWLEGRDVAERSVWVEQFREGDVSLGQIVQAVMEKRGAHWDAPVQEVAAASSRAPYSPQLNTPDKKQRRDQAKGQGRHKPPADIKALPANAPLGGPPQTPKMDPGQVANKLRDGTALCPDFQKGKCAVKGASCAQGAHKCGKVLRNGRPCGMAFHGAHNCRNV